MKFSGFKEISQIEASSAQGVVGYLTGALSAMIRDLRAGLNKLAFSDNFESFKVDLTFAASEEVRIPNLLRTAIPTEWIVVRNQLNGASVVEGDNAWTKDTLYLKNSSANPITVTVRFFR